MPASRPSRTRSTSAAHAFGGKPAFILVPGIDVPFHSTVLRDGVADFRDRLDDLLPATIDPRSWSVATCPTSCRSRSRSTGRSSRRSPTSSPRRRSSGARRLGDLGGRPGQLCRVVLIELLAWQFASPVRWIETQDLFFGSPEHGGLGIERFVEIGVGHAPTLANLAS